MNSKFIKYLSRLCLTIVIVSTLVACEKNGSNTELYPLTTDTAPELQEKKAVYSLTQCKDGTKNSLKYSSQLSIKSANLLDSGTQTISAELVEIIPIYYYGEELRVYLMSESELQDRVPPENNLDDVFLVVSIDYDQYEIVNEQKTLSMTLAQKNEYGEEETLTYSIEITGDEMEKAKLIMEIDEDKEQIYDLTQNPSLSYNCENFIPTVTDGQEVN